MNLPADGPVERSDKAKKEMKGSKDPKRRVILSVTPAEAMLWENCSRTFEARVRPAMAWTVLFPEGVLNVHCWAEASVYSRSRSRAVKDESLESVPL